MNFNDNDIDKIIKDSIEKVELPEEIFKEAYNNLENKKNSTIIFKFSIGIAAVVIAIFLVILSIKTNNKEDNYTPDINGSTEEIQSEQPIASYTIDESGDSYQPIINHLSSPLGMTLIEEDSQFVGIVKVKKISGYTNYLKEQDMYSKTPFIISEVEIEKVYKGDLSGTINIASYGGVISISDYEKALLDGQTLPSRYKDFTEEEKKNTYVNIINSITMSTLEPEVGKYYLVFMNYSKNLECYQVLDDLIYEYDIENNKTKNTYTNEWEDYEFGKK